MPTLRERKNKAGIITAIQCMIRCKGVNVTKDFPIEKGRKNYREIKDKAVSWGRDIEKQIKEGIYKQEYKQHNFTVKEALEKYIADGNPKRDSEIVRNREINCLNWFKKEIGHIPMKLLVRSDLKKCRDKLINKKKEIPIKNKAPKISDETISNSCVNRYLAYFSAFLSYCVYEYEIVETNVMIGAKLKLPENEPRKRWIKKAEDRVNLLKVFSEKNEQLYLGTLIMLTTGARNQEVVKLTWQDTDFENRAIYFRDTKNGDDRTIPMPDILFEKLSEYKKKSKIRKLNADNNYLFTNTKGEMNKCLFYEVGNEIINDVGLNTPKKIKQENGKLTMYNIRHTFTSIGGLIGINTDIMDKITGHRNGRMTSRYTHADCESLREPINKIANYMLGIDDSDSSKNKSKK